MNNSFLFLFIIFIGMGTEIVTVLNCEANNNTILVEKLGTGVYCVVINGTDHIFQTYLGLFECLEEIFNNDYVIMFNISSIIEKIYNDWEFQIENDNYKSSKSLQKLFEEV